MITKEEYYEFRKQENKIKQRICDIGNTLIELDVVYSIFDDWDYAYDMEAFLVEESEYEISNREVFVECGDNTYKKFKEEFIWDENALQSYIEEIKESYKKKQKERLDRHKIVNQKKDEEDYKKYLELKEKFEKS